MFCNKCGKQNQDGARFCAYCGAELRSYETHKTPMPLQPNKAGTKLGKGRLHSVQRDVEMEMAGRGTGIKASDIVLILLYVLLVLPWAKMFSSNYEATEMAFDWLGEDGIKGMVCYILFFALILAVAVGGIIEVIRHKYHLSLGVAAIALSIVVAIGQQVYDEISLEIWELIGYRVFRVYGEIWFRSLVISLLLTVLLCAKYLQDRPRMKG